MPRESYRERALIIRTYDLVEADRIIVFLTQGRGLVRGVAKGVRRAKSRFGSRLQPFVELDVQFYAGRGLESITAADTVGFYATGIITDLTCYSAASAVLEAAERLAQSHEEHLYPLVVDTLKQLQHTTEPKLRLDAFLLQAMDLAGWAPSLFHCAQCQTPGPHHSFHPYPGGAVCEHCRPHKAAEVDPEVLHAMWLLQRDQWDAALGLIMDHPPRFATAIHQLTKAHWQWHTERKLSSFSVLDQA
ncbi:MAG: DNA repair protein RecO [Corynebacterium sp.]|nr:DNA repair protein RecO [Corynebacterium sp.]